MKNIWKALDGHKTQITGILPFVIAFAVGRGYIQTDMAELLLVICGILFGGSVIHHEMKNDK
jgi:hypothetical protein